MEDSAEVEGEHEQNYTSDAWQVDANSLGLGCNTREQGSSPPVWKAFWSLLSAYSRHLVLYPSQVPPAVSITVVLNL
jgi:hypothetical protein